MTTYSLQIVTAIAITITLFTQYYLIVMSLANRHLQLGIIMILKVNNVMQKKQIGALLDEVDLAELEKQADWHFARHEKILKYVPKIVRPK